MHFIKHTLAVCATVFALSGCGEGAHQHSTPVGHDAQHPTTHNHDDHAHHDAQQMLRLDNGQKWATDEALRHAMRGIHDLLRPHLARQSDANDLAQLAQGVRDNIDYMVQNCKLEPEADAVLHIILGEMFEGVALLEGEQGDDMRHQGIERIAHALHQYAEYFQHPDFEAVPVPH